MGCFVIKATIYISGKLAPAWCKDRYSALSQCSFHQAMSNEVNSHPPSSATKSEISATYAKLKINLQTWQVNALASPMGK